jgi:hypothetical protein
MAPFGSGTEVIPEPRRAKKWMPPKKMGYKHRFVKKGRKMVANADDEEKTTAKTHRGGFRDVARWKAWTEVGFDKYPSSGTMGGRT